MTPKGFNKISMLLGVLILIEIITGYPIAVVKSNFKVHQVNSFADVRDLADLRYNEWIVGSDEDEREQPSLAAFRMATAEVHQERKDQGAKIFIAKCEETGVAVGSAEISPIEVENCCTSDNPYLYITDVVTSFSHRRKGIGKKLLNTLEQEAINCGIGNVCLHVDKQNNEAAFQFYMRNGYSECNETDGKLNETQLTTNTGTSGQVLLAKELKISLKKNTPKKSKGIGFGNMPKRRRR